MSSYRFAAVGPRRDHKFWRVVDRKPRRAETVAHFYGETAEGLARAFAKAMNEGELEEAGGEI